MKKLIRLVILLLIIFFSLIFYQAYFKKEVLIEKKTSEVDVLPTTKVENNLIKDLKYEINLGEDKKYILTSQFSEITYENGLEIVIMEKVKAIIINKNMESVEIISDIARYNSSSYETIFRDNVNIKYMTNKISSNQMKFDFDKSLIKIYENVEYKGVLGHLFADNLDINLLMNTFNIYMNDEKKKIKIITNY